MKSIVETITIKYICNDINLNERIENFKENLLITFVWGIVMIKESISNYKLKY